MGEIRDKLLNFHYLYLPGQVKDTPTLLLLHGTGGDEDDLVPLAEKTASGWPVLSLRGSVSENGLNRFFSRVAEGVFDPAEIKARVKDLAEFIEVVSLKFELSSLVALGYSNGANMAVALMLQRPDLLSGAVLLRAMPVIYTEGEVDLDAVKVLLLSGITDPLISTDQSRELYQQLSSAGAKAEHLELEAGHQLTAEDIELTARWLTDF